MKITDRECQRNRLPREYERLNSICFIENPRQNGFNRKTQCDLLQAATHGRCQYITGHRQKRNKKKHKGMEKKIRTSNLHFAKRCDCQSGLRRERQQPCCWTKIFYPKKWKQQLVLKMACRRRVKHWRLRFAVIFRSVKLNMISHPEYVNNWYCKSRKCEKNSLRSNEQYFFRRCQHKTKWQMLNQNVMHAQVKL